jgi:hypothetical protein
MKEGVFLSAPALERTRSAFAEVARSLADSGFKQSKLGSELVDKVGLRDDSGFDDYYLCLYISHLANIGSLHIEPNAKPGLSKLLALKALLDINLPEYKPGMTFDQTLLDEYLVADILLFTKAVKQIIPYATYVEGIGLGCVWLEFGVYGDRKGFTPGRDLPFLSKKVAEASSAETEHPAWRDAKMRFRVAAVELNPV